MTKKLTIPNDQPTTTVDPVSIHEDRDLKLRENSVDVSQAGNNISEKNVEDYSSDFTGEIIYPDIDIAFM
jgi:hypothetical protein